MAQSAVEICNRALYAVGRGRITSLTQETPAADLCNTFYLPARDELLQDHPWNFAKKRVQLAALSTAPAFEWTNQFELPVDCVRVIAIGDGMLLAGSNPLSGMIVNQVLPPLPTWEVEGRVLLTNESAPLDVTYISNAVTEDEFAPKFATALALRIAVDLAMPLTESAAKRDALEKQFIVALRSARGSDAREHGPQNLYDPTLVLARI